MRRFRTRSRILRHITHGPATQNEAGRRVVLAGQDLEKACLACTIAADEPDLVPGIDGEVGVGEHTARRDVDGESSRLDHGGAKCYVRTQSAFRPTSHRPGGGSQMKKVLVVVVFLVLAAACGGGGSSGVSPTSKEGPNPPVAQGDGSRGTGVSGGTSN